ncbi:MAG: RNA polymerase factor sigma-54 [Pseudomonadota bacterium]
MALAPKLEFKQAQNLVMTPQLQQAIKLLQLSNLELREYVDKQLEENPFLEPSDIPADGPAERRGETKSDDASSDGDGKVGELTDGAGAQDMNAVAPTGGHDDAFDPARQTPSDDNAFRVNDWAGAGGGGARNFEDDDREFGATLKKEISLNEHLNEQLKVATRSSKTLLIGAYMIDLIDDAGYLRDDLGTIAHRLGADMADIVETHDLIKTFDPCGVGARDMKECLELQLIERDRFDPAMQAFVQNIELLAKADLKGLMKATDADEEDVRDMIAEIRSLTPKPGYAYSSDAVQVVAPDVFVYQADDGSWKVELNSATLPRILVNQHYYAEINAAKASEEDKVFVNEQFANANWLAKSLDQRARTILKVASEIVRKQDAFLAYGVKHLRPFNLKAVAEAIDMHESTVSRVTSNKYMATPRGVFELKYFFTASIASSSGGEAHSAEAVRQRIRELVDAETRESILSDDKIVEILQREGVDIARRTVAKYRETLKIPSSVQRRRQMTQGAI